MTRPGYLDVRRVSRPIPNCLLDCDYRSIELSILDDYMRAFPDMRVWFTPGFVQRYDYVRTYAEIKEAARRVVQLSESGEPIITAMQGMHIDLPSMLFPLHASTLALLTNN